jgi:hypothetical protein
MAGELVDLNAARGWEKTAHELFSTGPVGIMEIVDGEHTIFARVIGYVEDPTYGRLIQVERVDAGYSSTVHGY